LKRPARPAADRRGLARLSGLLIALILLAASPGPAAAAAAQEIGQNPWYRTGPEGELRITLHFFWSETCPYCAEAQDFLPALIRTRPWLDVESYEVSTSPANRQVFAEFAAALDQEILGVPAFFLCGQMLVGFDDAAGTGQLLASVADYCHALLSAEEGPPAPSPETSIETVTPGESPLAGEPPAAGLRLPVLGRVAPEQLSLPVLTVVLAGVDAFNPCAFFVLLFLLSLLVHTRSRARMLIIGGVFVVFSGLLYFVFMAAWLHLFLVLEGLRVVTTLAGAVALTLAVLTIRDYIRSRREGPQAATLSIPQSARPGLFARMRALLSAESLPAMLTGTVVLALAANTYELLCSSGLPLVYTRALTLDELSTAGYYGYLAFYNLVYVLPLLAIVVVFALTLGSRKLSAAEGRALKLLSGLMMLGLGLVLIAAPEWLDNWLLGVGLLAAAMAGTWIVTRRDRRNRSAEG
jgi:hypothetical protein